MNYNYDLSLILLNHLDYILILIIYIIIINIYKLNSLV